jgi:phosphatidylglycerophosphatase A
MNLKKFAFNGLATLGVGYIPFAPGTFGSLIGMLVWILVPDKWIGLAWKIYLPTMQIIPNLHDYTVYFIALLITLLFSLFAIWITGKAEKNLGHDSPKIILDEVCGIWLSVLFLPRTWMLYIYAFILFRAFDIAKPFPVKQIQKLPGGWGIVVDDLTAAVYVNLCLQVILHLKPSFFFLL